jgi:hypothetical protein
MTGAPAAFADAQPPLADLLAHAPNRTPILTLGGRTGHPEGNMAAANRGICSGSSWLALGTVFAATSGFLVAWGASVNSVRAGATEQLVDLLSWLPRVALLFIDVAMQAFCSADSIDAVFHWITNTTASLAVVSIFLALGLLRSGRAR